MVISVSHESQRYGGIKHATNGIILNTRACILYMVYISQKTVNEIIKEPQ